VFVIGKRLACCVVRATYRAGWQLENTRLNMTSNLKIVLSAVGVAALLASPALAKTVRHHQAPSLVSVPADARASIAPSAAPAVTPYAADVKTQVHPTNGLNPDFQLSTE
jgi:hypothetical protein